MGLSNWNNTGETAPSGKGSGWVGRLRPPFRSVMLNLLTIIVPIVVVILVDFALIVEKLSYDRQFADLNNRQIRTSYSQVILLAEPVKQGRLEDVELLLATIIGDPYFVGARVEGADGKTLVALGEDVDTGEAELRHTRDILYADGDVPEKVGRLTTLVTYGPILSGLARERQQLAVLAVVVLLTITGAVYIAYKVVVGGPIELLVAAIRSREEPSSRRLLKTPKVECAGSDEIAEMIADFNHAEKVRADHHWQLLEAKLTLEEKVRERTEALSHALSQAKSANEAKSTFLASMSHELRTPLNAIIGFAEVIQHSNPAEEDETRITNEHAGIIADSGRHLLGLLNTVLDYSKVQSGKMTLEESEFHMAEVVESATRTFSQNSKDKDIALEVDIVHSLPVIAGDVRKVKQILLNLLSNAIKFTEAGGTISVSMRHDPGGVSVAVADTGCGLGPDELDVVMRPFEQAKNAGGTRGSGTGLGLPLSREFAEMHGGTLEIDSIKGEGSTVTLWLPASRLVDPDAPKAAVG